MAEGRPAFSGSSFFSPLGGAESEEDYDLRYTGQDRRIQRDGKMA